ncbi:MAG: hypothetical protein WBL20_07715, partial [Sphingobium sp.]
MTVSTDLIGHRYFPGAAMAPEHLPFQFLADDHLIVTALPGDAPQVAGTDYVIEGDGAAGTATIRALRDFGVDGELQIVRVTARRQEAVTEAFKPLPAAAIGRELDRRALVEQEIGDLAGRGIVLPFGEQGVVLPRAAERAGGNKVLAPHPVTGEIGIFGGNAFRGDKGDKGDPGDQDGDALVWLDAFVEEGDASASEAFQRCHDWLAERIDFGETGIITVMLGSRTYHLGSAVLIDKVPMRFIGRGCAIGVAPGMGTWFTISDDSFTPFTITLGTQETRGCGFWNIGLYQTHPNVVSGWAPTDYPHIFDVQSLLGEFTLDHIYAVNINKLVNCDLSGRLNIDN